MATNPKDTAARKRVGKFARTLLATTALTVATGAAASAGTITYTEGQNSVPEFSNSSASPTPLAAAAIPGSTIVNGTVGGEGTDFFELTGLGAGTFTVTATDSFTEGTAEILLFNTSDTELGFTDFTHQEGASFKAQGIPSDGNLVVEIEGVLGGASYSVTVDTVAASAPEPGTLATAGLGLAGALALSRRRRKQQA